MKAFLFGALLLAAIGCNQRIPHEPSVQESTTVTARRLPLESEGDVADATTIENDAAVGGADESASDKPKHEADVDSSNLLRILTER